MYFVNMNTFWIWWLQHTPKKVGKEACLTMCHLLASKYFVQSRLIQDFRSSAVCDRHFLILLFMTGHTFSIGDRSGLQIGQSKMFTRSLRSHAVVAHAEWDPELSWSNNMDFPWKTSSWWHYLSLYNHNICIHAKGTIAHIPVTHAICTDAPSYHERRFASVAGESLDSPFRLWNWELNVRFSQEQAETCTHLTTLFHSLFDYLRWALAQRTRRHHCIDV